MLGITQIKNLEDLVGQYIETGKKIVDTRVVAVARRNYRSTVLEVDIVVKDESRYTQEILSVAAKVIPQRSFSQKVSQAAFKNEVKFYQSVLPILENFLRERGTKETMEYIPRFFGARLNLDGNSDEVDHDAVIILENFSRKDFKNLDRIFGCDLPITKLILKNLAHFHALPLAFRNSYPEKFIEQINPYLADTTRGTIWLTQEKAIITILEVLSESVTCMRTISRMKKYLEHTNSKDKTKISSHFHTICHNELWTKNVLVKFNRGNPDKVKLLGHTFHTFDSPIKDLILFFLTSVQIRVLRNNLDNLLRFYYQELVQNLKEFKIQIPQMSFELFMREFSIYTSQVIGRALFIFLFIIYGKDNGSNTPTEHPVLNSRDDIPLVAKEKVWWFVEECERRGWLNQ